MDLFAIATSNFTHALRQAITTASYQGKNYDNGVKAKEGLIRSQRLIQYFHDGLKQMLYDEISNHTNLSTLSWQIYPPLGQTNPELKIYGELKGKDQDIVFLNQPCQTEYIESLKSDDSVGFQASNSSIIVGVRSQMSSINKNFDTLMERAIAEAVNLNLRLPNATLVELYIIPLQEIDNNSAQKNKFQTEKNKVNIEKFINQFYSTTSHDGIINNYMMDAACLLILDLNNPGYYIKNSNQLSSLGYPAEICSKFELIQPDGFSSRIIECYLQNNPHYSNS